MKGSVRLKGKTWSYRIDIGKVDGKRKQVEKSGYKTEREALKAMNDVIYHYNHTGEYIENQKFTFQESSLLLKKLQPLVLMQRLRNMSHYIGIT